MRIFRYTYSWFKGGPNWPLRCLDWMLNREGEAHILLKEWFVGEHVLTRRSHIKFRNWRPSSGFSGRRWIASLWWSNGGSLLHAGVAEGDRKSTSMLLAAGARFWSINLNQNVWLVLSHIPPAWSSTHYHLLHVQYIFHVEWLICVGCKAPQCVASHLWNYCIHTLFLHISKCCKHVLWSNCFASKTAVA